MKKNNYIFLQIAGEPELVYAGPDSVKAGESWDAAVEVVRDGGGDAEWIRKGHRYKSTRHRLPVDPAAAVEESKEEETKE